MKPSTLNIILWFMNALKFTQTFKAFKTGFLNLYWKLLCVPTVANVSEAGNTALWCFKLYYCELNSQYFPLTHISNKQKLIVLTFMDHVVLNFTRVKHHNKPPENLGVKLGELFCADFVQDLLQQVDLLPAESCLN